MKAHCQLGYWGMSGFHLGVTHRRLPHMSNKFYPLNIQCYLQPKITSSSQLPITSRQHKLGSLYYCCVDDSGSEWIP